MPNALVQGTLRLLRLCELSLSRGNLEHPAIVDTPGRLCQILSSEQVGSIRIWELLRQLQEAALGLAVESL